MVPFLNYTVFLSRISLCTFFDKLSYLAVYTVSLLQSNMLDNTSMDDSVQAPISFSLQNSSRLAFRESYIQYLMPMLMSIQEQGSQFTAQERCNAVKHAADWSLASTAGETSWSKALCRKLSVGRSSEPGYAVLPATRKNSKARKLVPERRSFSSQASAEVRPLIHGRFVLKRLRRRRLMAKKQPLNHRKSYAKALHCSANQRQLSNPTDILTQPGSNCSTTLNQLASLRGIIPGGDEMDVPTLLEQAAHYIISLQLQVESLGCLAQVAVSA